MREGNGWQRARHVKERADGQVVRQLWAVDLGIVDYGEALHLQRRLVAAKKARELEADLLLLLEHPAVITLGRRGDESNVLAAPDVLAARGIQVHRVERGGDVTYHGPGQLVGYPIISLRHLPNRKDVGRFVWNIQEAIIRTLARYTIPAERIDKVIGVWVRRPAPDLALLNHHTARHGGLERIVAGFNDRKIAAIGARVEGWISYHGFALNVNTDLDDFNLILPCGLD
ncbi:MAG: lipoyl(octanoyl) transferase LipB, partial [Ardenticatenaceae bacterium]